MQVKQDFASLSRYLANVVLLAAIYFATAKAGLSLSPVSGFATLVWPPTGIALAALFLFGKSLWPGVFIGAVFVNFVTGAPLWVAIGIGVGNTFEPFIGASLLERFGFSRSLDRIKDVIILVGAGALFSTLISATIGTTSLLLGNTIELSSYARTWSAWWIGDMLGAIIATPLLMVWLRKQKLELSTKQIVEAFLLAMLCFALGILIFEDVITTSSLLSNVPYLLFPFMIWAALRFRVRLVVTLNALLTTLTVHAAINNYGPFKGETIDERLFSSQLFIGVTAVTFLTFSAAMAERRHAQAVSFRLNQQLKRALARKTTELRHEKETEKLKDEFVAIASHELKTPITSIKAFANLLDKKLTSSNDRNSALLASKIDSQADKLTRLIGELLDVSRIESGELVLDKTSLDMNLLLQKIITDFQYAVSTHSIVDNTRPLPTISGDKDRLEQVILNLLTNAVKYSPKAKKIIISSSVNNKELIVSIQDFGPGIPKKDLIKIFKRFYRTADTGKSKQTVSGIGLGLYIASEIIRQHKGKIWATSALGKGSIFSFSLPLK